MPEKKKRSEVITVFRYFSGIAMAYFATLVIFTAMQTGELINLDQIQSYLNLIINGVLFGYLSWIWLEKKLGRYYLPLALLAATVVPLFSNLIYLASPQETAQIAIMRSWLLFPILIGPTYEFARRWLLGRTSVSLDDAAGDLAVAAWRSVRPLAPTGLARSAPGSHHSSVVEE